MRREKNKEFTRNLLIKSAMELFKKQEYQKTTIEEITKAAGVSKPTFFAYFKSKEQILYEFDQQQLKTFEVTMKSQVNNHNNLLINLRKAIVYMAANLHTSSMITQNMMHLLTINEDYKRLLSDTFVMFQAVTKEIIDYGQHHKIVTMDITSEEIATDIVNIYLGSLVNWVISNGSESLVCRMGDTLDHFLSAITIKN
ncbi:TetR/AcrR family transcriptional regulator [Neobacillus sp. PS2-9]|uniref:TetR/AcrR family transcriptional regulator n=1 Tax=Neobacillus sp. PS2-9 TaxID=3070676 RepID=UPI0027E1AE6A|nr:TetR/AcrR family transcriptional regulator [Neobacillus sp. PS2-9]WML58704.1 TetR/AcrR family transcriptional regulator [Neobacillus sp. PS2-9]